MNRIIFVYLFILSHLILFQSFFYLTSWIDFFFSGFEWCFFFRQILQFNNPLSNGPCLCPKSKNTLYSPLSNTQIFFATLSIKAISQFFMPLFFYFYNFYKKKELNKGARMKCSSKSTLQNIHNCKDKKKLKTKSKRDHDTKISFFYE